MILPDYYNKFRCIGSECRNNCCRGGWEIEVDDESLERFNNAEGAFGEKIRTSINEENVFIHKNGQCPLLSSDGLCEMVKHGIDLCTVCDEYPRFTEFYEDYAERGISVSCEAAADIILNNTEKVKLTGDTGKCTHPIFSLIFNARNNVFEILQNREQDINTRLRLALNYTAELQERININNYDIFSYAPVDEKVSPCANLEYACLLTELNILNDGWNGYLDKLIENEKGEKLRSGNQIKLEQLAVYFTYRYFLKGAFDCDVLSKMKFVIVSVVTVSALAAICGDFNDCARLYSIEVEHDEDNVDAVYDEFLFNEKFSYDGIMSLIS